MVMMSKIKIFIITKEKTRTELIVKTEITIINTKITIELNNIKGNKATGIKINNIKKDLSSIKKDLENTRLDKLPEKEVIHHWNQHQTKLKNLNMFRRYDLNSSNENILIIFRLYSKYIYIYIIKT